MKGLEGKTVQPQPVNLQRVAKNTERLKGFWGIFFAYRTCVGPIRWVKIKTRKKP